MAAIPMSMMGTPMADRSDGPAAYQPTPITTRFTTTAGDRAHVLPRSKAAAHASTPTARHQVVDDLGGEDFPAQDGVVTGVHEEEHAEDQKREAG